MVRSMWLPLTSGVASVCVGLALWPSLASPADGLSLFSAAAADSLLQKLPLLGRSGSSTGWSPPADLQDLRVTNVSIHRVRYERATESAAAAPPQDVHVQEAEETLVRSLFGSAWAAATRKARFSGGSHATPAASVVVTWEDHPLAAAARPNAERLCSATPSDDETACAPSDKHETQPSGRSVVYDVQVWVNGWGLDPFWHPANRKLSTTDPFVVVQGLPHEQEELAVRVRMKVQTRVAGLWFMTSEVDGPWSDVVTLSPAAEPALETLVAFFAGHQILGGVLALLVALSTLVILRLVVTSALQGRHAKASGQSPLAMATRQDEVDERVAGHSVIGLKSLRHQHHHHRSLHTKRRTRVPSVDLEQEVADLRQELADSEAEVRRLMLFRGYGIDELRENELEELESELRRTLKLVQKRRRLQHFESLDETEEEEEDEDDEVAAAVDGKRRDERVGALKTVDEESA